MAQLVGGSPVTEGLLVPFQVRAHAQVLGLIPVGILTGGSQWQFVSHIEASLSLSTPCPLL